MIRVAWAIPFLALTVCAACAIRSRLRYARQMRGPLPWWDQDVRYSRRQWLAIVDAWEAPPARPERSRT